MKCPKCGFPNRYTAEFCIDCGLRLLRESASPHTEKQVEDKFSAMDFPSFTEFMNYVLDNAMYQIRYKHILTERMGLNDGSVKTLKEVGRSIHLSAERTRENEARALRILASYLKINCPKFYNAVLQIIDDSQGMATIDDLVSGLREVFKWNDISRDAMKKLIEYNPYFRVESLSIP